MWRSYTTIWRLTSLLWKTARLWSWDRPPLTTFKRKVKIWETFRRKVLYTIMRDKKRETKDLSSNRPLDLDIGIEHWVTGHLSSRSLTESARDRTSYNWRMKREKTYRIKTNNQELLIRKQNESDATSWWIEKPRYRSHLWEVREFYFVLIMKSHLQSYPCPLQIKEIKMMNGMKV
jgi:hypothetical protein